MNTIKFPFHKYQEHTKSAPDKFSYPAMVLICLNNFLKKLILANIFGQKYKLSKKYKYYLSNFEIKFLGTIKEQDSENVFETTYYKSPYNFVLNTFKKRYKGVFDICVEFKNNNSLENSFFEISIKITPEVDFEIWFDFINQDNLLKTSEELFTKLWNQVFKEIHKFEIAGFSLSDDSVDANEYTTSDIFVNRDIDDAVKDLIQDSHFSFDDSIVDLYHILMHLFLANKTTNNQIYIKTDDILRCRKLKENTKISGNKGGFKEHQKQKIRINLALLDLITTMNVQELEKDFYAINIKDYQTEEYFIPRKLIEYNPKTQVWQKRIGEYLYFEKEIRKSNRLKIRAHKLLDIVKDQFSSLKPALIRDKLENTLDALINEGIVTGWQYKNIQEEKCTGVNWLDYYKKLNIEIEI